MFTRPNFLQGANDLPMVVAALVDEILVMATVVDFAHIPVGEMGHSLHRRQILGARKRADMFIAFQRTPLNFANSVRLTGLRSAMRLAPPRSCLGRTTIVMDITCIRAKAVGCALIAG